MKKLATLIALGFLSVQYTWAQDIVAIEYAIDQDNGFGNSTVVSVTPSQDSSFSFSVNTTGLSKGNHMLLLRTLDSDGKWSHTSNRTIEILDDVSADLVESVEFFNDTLKDFGTGHGVTFSAPQADGSFIVNFPYSGVTPGTVTLYARVKDTKGLWSFPAWKEITIRLENDPPPNGIAEINGNPLHIYPNPASGMVTLNFGSVPDEPAHITLTDIHGKTLHTRTVQAQEVQLDLDYAPGIYLLGIRSGDQVVSKKLTVIK